MLNATFSGFPALIPHSVESSVGGCHVCFSTLSDGVHVDHLQSLFSKLQGLSAHVTFRRWHALEGSVFWRRKWGEYRWVKWVVSGVSACWLPAVFSCSYPTLFGSLSHPGVRPSPLSFIMNINSNMHVNTLHTLQTHSVHTHITALSVMLCHPELLTINLHGCMLEFTW